MSGVGRYVKFTAQPGRGEEVAQLLLAAAESPEPHELEPLGGVGYLAGGSGYTLVKGRR